VDEVATGAAVEGDAWGIQVVVAVCDVYYVFVLGMKEGVF
jgi:hypothetical protein